MAITELEHRVLINKSVQEVFNYISRAENMTQWAEKVTHAEQTSEGPVDVGTTCYIVSKAMGMHIRQDFVVTECEENRLYAAKSMSGPVPVETKYVLEPTDSGTDLHVTASVDLKDMMQFAGPLLTGKLRNQLQEDHDNLKRVLESGLTAHNGNS